MTVLGKSRAFQRRQGGPGFVTSPPGLVWQGMRQPTEPSFDGAAPFYWASKGKWYFIFVNSVLMESPDGINWTRSGVAPGFLTSDCSLGVVGSQERLVATVSGIKGAGVAYSDDGYSFVPVDAGFTGGQFVAFGQGKWIAANGSATTYQSGDGISWSPVPMPASVQQVFFGGPPGNEKWICPDSFANPKNIYVSSDGISWTTITLPVVGSWTHGIRNIAWGGIPGSEVFVIAGTTANLYSVDGIAWTVSPSFVGWMQRVSAGGIVGGERFVATLTGNIVATSQDGITWAAGASLGNSARACAWGGAPGSEKWVIGRTGIAGAQVMTSLDAITWTIRATPSFSGPPYCPTVSCRSVVWAEAFDRFLVVASDNNVSLPSVGYSLDGIEYTWSAGPVNVWNEISYGGQAGAECAVAVAQSGANSRVMRTADGVSWSLIPGITANTWNSVTWGGSAGSELFVAVASSGTNRIMTSPDGITWTDRAAPTSRSWQGVAWGGPAGGELFVAVCNNAAEVMTSPDGITWTARPASNTGIVAVIWFEDAGEFIAAGFSGQAMRSPDGITWTSVTVPTTSAIRRLSVGGSNGYRFVMITVQTPDLFVITSRNGADWQVGQKIPATLYNAAWSPSLQRWSGCSTSNGWRNVWVSNVERSR